MPILTVCNTSRARHWCGVRRRAQCADMMVLGNHDIPFSEAVARIRADGLFISVDSDFLTPPQQLQSIHRILASHGRRSSHVELSTPYGHDTAFKDVSEIGPLVRQHLERGVENDLRKEEFQTTGLAAP